MSPRSEPLTEAYAAELRAEGLWHSVVVLDGVPYSAEDLPRCGGCATCAPDGWELDDDGLCRACAEEVRAEEEHLRQLRSDYYAAVL